MRVLIMPIFTSNCHPCTLLFSEFIDQNHNKIITGDIDEIQHSEERYEIFKSKYKPTLKPDYG